MAKALMTELLSIVNSIGMSGRWLSWCRRITMVPR